MHKAIQYQLSSALFDRHTTRLPQVSQQPLDQTWSGTNLLRGLSRAKSRTAPIRSNLLHAEFTIQIPLRQSTFRNAKPGGLVSHANVHIDLTIYVELTYIGSNIHGDKEE